MFNKQRQRLCTAVYFLLFVIIFTELKKVFNDKTKSETYIQNELTAHRVNISSSEPPPNVIIRVYCKDRIETSASIKFIFLSILMPRFISYLVLTMLRVEIKILNEVYPAIAIAGISEKFIALF